MRLGACALLACVFLSSCSEDRTVTCTDVTSAAERWRQADYDSDARFDAARELSRCKFLRGVERARVRELLGEPELPHSRRRQEGARRWIYSVGWVNDGIGPGDGADMYVRFARDHVKGVTAPREDGG